MGDRWTRLTIAQVFQLKPKPSTIGIYTHLQQPVRWIRLTGILTAVEDHEQRWLLTLDDGSGLAIQLIIKKELAQELTCLEAKRVVEDGMGLRKRVEPQGASMRGIGRGSCVDVRGTIGQFRAVRQMQVLRIALVETTEMEVETWELRNALQRRMIKRLAHERLERPQAPPVLRRRDSLETASSSDSSSTASRSSSRPRSEDRSAVDVDDAPSLPSYVQKPAISKLSEGEMQAQFAWMAYYEQRNAEHEASMQEETSPTEEAPPEQPIAKPDEPQISKNDQKSRARRRRDNKRLQMQKSMTVASDRSQDAACRTPSLCIHRRRRRK